MPIAFLLICSMISQKEILKALREIEEVKEIYLFYGPYDVLLKVDCESVDKLEEITERKLKPLKSVETLTMVVRKQK